MPSLLRRLVPTFLFPLYHKTVAVLADIRTGRPSRKLIVIGITGTKGKTTTANLAHHLLQQAGYKTALSSSVYQSVGNELLVNRSKMTTPGRGQLQTLLHEALQNGCTHAVVELSSEAVTQFRHIGIRCDVMVLTNLTPEHIDSHGSFTAYRDAKAALFAYAAAQPSKQIGGHVIPRVRILPADSISPVDMAPFLQPVFSLTFRFSPDAILEAHAATAVYARDIREEDGRPSFDLVAGTELYPVAMHMLGRFSVANALAASTAVHAVGVPWPVLVRGLFTFAGVPGRMESLQEEPFRVLVDYAHEPASYAAALSATRRITTHGQVLVVIGSAGGSRDVSRRPLLGKLAAEYADVIVVTNEDPYDTDPMTIIRHIAVGAQSVGAKPDERLFTFLDRREAIRYAIGRAKPGDTVLLLGKGAEPVMAVADGKMIPWDDRAVAREMLAETKPQ